MIDTTKAPASEHYKKLAIEPIELIKALKLDFMAGSFVKYLVRYQYKGSPKTDLEKAKFYLSEIKREKYSLLNDQTAWYLVFFFAAANRMDEIETNCLLNALDGFQQNAKEGLDELIVKYNEPARPNTRQGE